MSSDTQPETLTAEEASEALRAAAFTIQPGYEGAGRTIVHCLVGGLGADWDHDEALDLVANAERVMWTDHFMDHDLAIQANGKVYHFNVRRPERSAPASEPEPTTMATDPKPATMRVINIALDHNELPREIVVVASAAVCARINAELGESLKATGVTFVADEPVTLPILTAGRIAHHFGRMVPTDDTITEVYDCLVGVVFNRFWEGGLAEYWPED